MEKLIEILNQFYQKKTESNLWNEETIANCFYPLAKKILCKGYFLVNDKYIIDLGAIELYYHEEDGEIKDHIMSLLSTKKSISFFETVVKSGNSRDFSSQRI